jgi:hypothetical protein
MSLISDEGRSPTTDLPTRFGVQALVTGRPSRWSPLQESEMQIKLVAKSEWQALLGQSTALQTLTAKQLAVYHELYDADERFPTWGECLWQR